MQKSTSKIQEPTNSNYIKWAYRTFLVISVLFLLFNTLFKNDKIAYVDSAKILSEFKGSAEAKKAFDAKTKTWQANIDTLGSEVKTSIQKYEKSIATMSPKEQAMAKQLIQIKQKQLQDYQRAIQQDAKQEEGKLMQGVVIQINKFLSDYGKKNNYKLILIANQTGTIAYGRDGLDITKDVIEELNKDYITNGK